MARGFFSGIVWGSTVGLSVSAIASVLAPMPVAPEITDVAPQAVSAPERVAVAISSARRSTPDRALVTGQVAPQAALPDVDTVIALNTDTIETVAKPQAGRAAALEVPAEAARSVGLSLAPESPVIPNPQALAPMEPQPMQAVAVNTNPGARPAPSREAIVGSFDAPAQPASEAGNYASQDAISPPAVSEVSFSVAVPQAPASPVAAGTTQDLADSTVTAPQTEATLVSVVKEEFHVVALDPPLALIAPAVVAVPASVEGPVSALQSPTETATDAPPEVVEETAKPLVAAEDPVPAAVTPKPATSATVTPEAETETVLAQAQTTQTEAQPNVPELGSSSVVVRRAIGTPSGTLTERTNGVTINRAGVQSTEPQQAEAEVTVTEAPAGEDQPLIKRFSEEFENGDNKPLMSIVLIDDGSSVVAGAEGIAALGEFPYTLSFAVDASLSDAADRMAIYRAAGFEVLAMVDLPEGALPSDAETTLGVVLPAMDEVVGVLEGTKGGLQGSRDVADQVTAILAQSGHGLVTQDKGLNTMPKLAVKEGVPADPIFRDFDSKGQTSQVIRRFLDQAAFRAGQEGAVVMLGRLRPDTVSALLLWGLQDRAGKVALAPISAVLTRER